MHIQTEALQLSSLTDCVVLLGKTPKITAGVTLRGLEKQGVGASVCANTAFHMSRLKIQAQGHHIDVTTNTAMLLSQDCISACV